MTSSSVVYSILTGEDLVLQVKRDEVGRQLENVVTAAGKEVERDNGVLGIIVNLLAVDQDADEARADSERGVVLDLDAAGDLEARRDGAAVELVDAADAALEDAADVSASELELSDGVAKGEGDQDVATRQSRHPQKRGTRTWRQP
ncbi:hypothetical protein HYQ46_009017 [Verticillium longisporum]|nr:hypothetical protein HYQ46_009017 [Verticillium longisporum]